RFSPKPVRPWLPDMGWCRLRRHRCAITLRAPHLRPAPPDSVEPYGSHPRRSALAARHGLVSPSAPSLRDHPAGAPSPPGSAGLRRTIWFSPTSVRFGCPTWVRTMTTSYRFQKSCKELFHRGRASIDERYLLHSAALDARDFCVPQGKLSVLVCDLRLPQN